MWESLMRLTVLSSDACDDSGGFRCCLGIDVAITDEEDGGLSLLWSLEAILLQISLHQLLLFTKTSVIKVYNINIHGISNMQK